MNKLGLTCCFLTLALGAAAQGQVTGYVYQDANRNGQRDGSEKGLANVSVSNGVQVVQTDRDGRYTLPVGNDNVIFVIKPAGYQAPLDAFNLPKTYYIHKPDGSPATLEYPGVAPTGALPASVDFALEAADESGDFKALVFGDPQAYTKEEMEFFAKGIVSEVAGIRNVAFGISLGDLVGDVLSLHPDYKQAVAKIGIPWYNLMGNHDMNYDVTADSLADETYEANFGPANYAFNYGNAHFIVLDDILYPDPRDGNGYWGGFRKDQLDFVENDLRFVDKNKLVVLAFHIPLDHRNGDTFRPEDRQRLFDLLRDFPHTLSLSAHMHTQTQHFYTREDGWQQEKPHHEYNVGTTSGDWYSGQLNKQGVPDATMRDGTPNGYAFLHIADNQYRLEYKVAGEPADYQINVFNPKVVAQGQRTRAGIFANFFMGHHGNTVEYRVDDGEWRRMTPVQSADPAYLALVHPWDNSEELIPGRRPTDAVPSTHVWRAAIPTNLAIGTHTVEVRATDDYGNTFTQTSTYRIEQAK
ncbi:calcineurin-like phosphoesterase family protein [Parapedobacter lycopersici]|uniref:calcineurin-like phosphoesterase family protein n=1 Tax=Parapedobacter lycopersici TaxID=1864939 RepID=UPI003340349F